MGIVGVFYMLQSCDMGQTGFPSEGMIFSPEKSDGFGRV
jgi:hypothetical protein